MSEGAGGWEGWGGGWVLLCVNADVDHGLVGVGSGLVVVVVGGGGGCEGWGWGGGGEGVNTLE